VWYELNSWIQYRLIIVFREVVSTSKAAFVWSFSLTSWIDADADDASIVLHTCHTEFTKAFVLQNVLFLWYPLKCRFIYVRRVITAHLRWFPWKSHKLNSIMCRSLALNFIEIKVTVKYHNSLAPFSKVWFSLRRFSRSSSQAVKEFSRRLITTSPNVYYFS
jgi:hypothetical protein